MGVYVNLKCRSCGKSITGGYTQIYAGIGEPLLKCPRCQTLNSHAKRCTEWQLMGDAKRIWLVMSLIWSTLFIWGFSGFAAAAFLDHQGVVDSDGFIATMIVVPLIGFLRLFLYFRRSIRSSRDRMADPQYRRKLQQHGFL